MNYGYDPQEMDTAQDLVVRAGRRADPPIHDAYAHRQYLIQNKHIILTLVCKIGVFYERVFDSLYWSCLKMYIANLVGVD